jgi:hypothetical protein
MTVQCNPVDLGRCEHGKHLVGPRQWDGLIPAALTSASSLAFEGGVFKYSITSGSTPLLRIIARVLREVPHLGL